ADEIPRMGLEQFIAEAEKNGGELREQEGKVVFAKAREQMVQGKAWPQGSIEVFSGPSPAASGNALLGSSSWNEWGVFWGTKAEFVQPLYTFGALSSGRRAAN